ncbi:MAG: PQQ-binding-like beta-propeller repeat protein [Acidobacteria bacterium]|nr:PQQ-binding-like beta-propeller repeat protein [Acidobacteriota bacterium]
MKKSWVFALPALVLTAAQGPAADRYNEWKVYGGGPESIRYSTLSQISRDNVRDLQVAWSYDTGDAFPGSEMQCNPIIVDGVLYATTPKLRVVALNAATGRLIWSFDPFDGRPSASKKRNRGVSYWSEGGDRRIFVAARHFLYALDAGTGRPVPSFGNDGRVDLREGLGRDPRSLNIGATTPGIVYRDMLILGGITGESLPAAPGDIRAFDVRTGKIRWSFHTIPHPGEFGYDTWPSDAWKYIGAANNWAGMALDEKRGLVFVPTGSAAFDFYGANRRGDNLFANSLLALRAATGERVWHFQFVKHDVWDRDLPAPPALVTVRRNGRAVDAVAQTTKSGHVFVFERETGKPLFPIEYRKVQQTDVDGEALAGMQPFPLKPPPFTRQWFTEEMITRRTPEVHRAVREQYQKLRYAGPFTPPSREGTIVFPGFDGGGEWGGAAFDPETRLLYVNSNELVQILRLVPRPPARARASGRELYARHCASCHRDDLKGTPPEFPSLAGIRDKHEDGEITRVIREGSGRMPGFAHLQPAGLRAVMRYIAFGEDEAVAGTPGPSPIDQKYGIDGYNKFLDPEGYPPIEPPWGTLNAINLDTGEIAWKIPFGEYPELAAKGLRNTGTDNYGGPLVTSSGLLFIGATNYDRKFRAFDKLTGKLLWETTLPFAGNATPATYVVNGRQYLVIAAGGGKSKTPAGGAYVAFALPAPGRH